MRINLKRIFCFIAALFVTFALAQETLPVYKKVKNDVDESAPIGQLSKSDWIKELPIPKDKVQKVSWVKETVEVTDRKGRPVKDKKGRVKTKTKKKKVVTWVEQEPKEPPTYVPIDCKLGTVWVRRAELARFQQEALDLSGEYASATGSVYLKKSPNNPKRFDVTIQNGPEGNRAEIEMGNLEIRESNGHARFAYQEEGCSVDIAVTGRKVKVAQRGCNEYNAGQYKLEGDYDTYKGNTRKVVSFNMPEVELKFKKFLWCGSGFDSCEEMKDEHGAVFITWSKGGKGFIERKAGETVHTYRPFEPVIPHKREFYKGEKPIAIKTKRTDMAGEWMIWYYYPKAERFKMVRAGMRYDIAYMEIYE